MPKRIDPSLVAEIERIATLADKVHLALVGQEMAGLTDEEFGLNQAIELLDHEGRATLLAVMILGRGDNGTDFERFLQDMRERGESLGVGYISGKAPLAEYLRNGIAILRNKGRA